MSWDLEILKIGRPVEYFEDVCLKPEEHAKVIGGMTLPHLVAYLPNTETVVGALQFGIKGMKPEFMDDHIVIVGTGVDLETVSRCPEREEVVVLAKARRVERWRIANKPAKKA